MTSKRELKNKVEGLGVDKPEKGIKIRIHEQVVNEDLNVIDESTTVIEYEGDRV